jgi:hypothetical protein
MARKLLGSSDASGTPALDIARGIYTDVGFINKFGANPLIDSGDVATDIWEYGQTVPVAPLADWGTAPIDSVSSDVDADAVDIAVQGLDINGLEVTQTVTLSGYTRVALPTPLWRVFRLENRDNNQTTGKGDSIAGIVYCYANTAIEDGVPTDTSKVYAIINDGNNQTQMCNYTVPANKFGYIAAAEIGIAKSGGATSNAAFQIRVRGFGGAFLTKQTVLVSDHASFYQSERPVWDRVPPLTDIKCICTAVSANGTAVWATMSIILIDVVAEEPFSG